MRGEAISDQLVSAQQKSAMTPDDLRRMGRKAWSNVEHMAVLVDMAQENGLDVRTLLDSYRSCYTGKDAGPDDELYALESHVRKVVLRAINPRLKLRVTGMFPDLRYVVIKLRRTDVRFGLPPSKIHFMGRLHQPRLLRSTRSWTFGQGNLIDDALNRSVTVSAVDRQQAMDLAQEELNDRWIKAGRTPPAGYNLHLLGRP